MANHFIINKKDCIIVLLIPHCIITLIKIMKEYYLSTAILEPRNSS